MSEYEKIKAERVAEIGGFFSESPEETWQRIEPVLVAEPRVYEGHVGRGWLRPLPYDLVEAYIDRFPDECERFLTQALSHADPRVVAYALIGLEMINSQILENLPASLLTRTELIETAHGCFVMEKSLGGFALDKQEDAVEMKSGEVCEDANGDT